MARRKGDGTLFTRGETWDVAFKLDGKRCDKALGTSGRADAEFRAKQCIETLPSLGMRQAKIRAVGISLHDVLGVFKSKADCAAIIFAGYGNAWTQFRAFLKRYGVCDASRIAPMLAEQWMECLKGKKVRGRVIGLETLDMLC